MKVLYLGPEGSYSQIASKQMFRSPSAVRAGDEFILCETSKQIFEQLDSAPNQVGVIPIENSIGGDIDESLSQLFTTKYHIVRELYLNTEHVLLINPTSDISKISKVLLGPQSKIQCSHFLNKHPDWEQVVVSSNSEGARIVSEFKNNDAAAIGSSIAGRLYNLKVIQRNIDNVKSNITRFVAIVRHLFDFPSGSANKCTIVFELSDKAGSLYKVLSMLAQRNYNLTKIGSRPIPEKPWSYRFFAEFAFTEFLDLSKIQEVAENLKIVGIYNQGKQLDEVVS